jgi:uncharacterized protein (DUF58 family)
LSLPREKPMPDAAPKTPGVYVDLEDLLSFEQKGRKVSFLPRQPVHSLLSGRFASRMRGRGLSFEEIRDYRGGDDVRSIDWKVTARLRRPHVRVFNEERDRPALLLIDQRLSMFFGSRQMLKSVTAAQAAAIAAWRVLGAGDRIGALVFNDREIVEIRPRRSRQTVLQILATVAAQNRALGVGRGIVSAAAMLNRVLGRTRHLALHDAVVIVISDFDGADQLTRGLVAALDGELQILLDVGRDSVRKDITHAVQQRLSEVFAWTPELGIPVLPLSAAEDTPTQLRRLLGRLSMRQGRSGMHEPMGAALG